MIYKLEIITNYSNIPCHYHGYSSIDNIDSPGCCTFDHDDDDDEDDYDDDDDDGDDDDNDDDDDGDDDDRIYIAPISHLKQLNHALHILMSISTYLKLLFS